MKRAKAYQEAHRRWGTPGTAPGDRYGTVIVRQKKVLDRFEVGYAIRGGSADSGMLMHQWVLMGSGSSWEEAFVRADGRGGTLTVLHNDAGSAVGNRFLNAGGAPKVLTVGQMAMLNGQSSQGAASITDDQIREVLASTLGKGKRQNAHTRALRVDCQAALEGDLTCRERIAVVIAERVKARGGS